MTTPKFDKFYDELVMLLNNHQVMLTTTLYDGILVKDRREGDPPIYCDFADHTNPEPIPEPKWVTYEVCHPDFIADGKHDDLVFWVASKDPALVYDVIVPRGASCHEVIWGDSDIDFHLPRDNDRFKAALQ